MQYLGNDARELRMTPLEPRRGKILTQTPSLTPVWVATSRACA